MDRSRLYRDDAVVLRVQKLGEADHIVTLLTRRYGKVRAVAKGVRRTSSRFGARLEPFGQIDVQLAVGKSLHIVSQVEGIALHSRIIGADYPRYTAASAIAETADRLAPDEHEPVPRLYALTAGALIALAANRHTASLILDAYLLRSMGLAGWAPALHECAVCGSRRADGGPHTAFSVTAGGIVCPTCRPPGASTPAPASVGLMAALESADWVAADASEPRARREASGLIAAHLQWHLERNLRALPLVDRSGAGQVVVDRAGEFA